MRRSVHDERYRKDIPFLKVFVDGKEIRHCIEADTSLNTAWVYEKDGNGNFVVENGELKTKMLYGDVKIVKVKR